MIKTKREAVAGLALLTTLMGGTVALAPPAQAHSAIVVEPGVPGNDGGNVRCNQWLDARDGARLLNFTAEPRIEQLRVVRVRYWDRSKRRWAYRNAERWSWLGGRASAMEMQTHRNNGLLSDPGPHTADWSFQRRRERGGVIYRCVVFVQGEALDSHGKRYKFRYTGVTPRHNWRRF